jgi:opacity protein-like surface antigen
MMNSLKTAFLAFCSSLFFTSTAQEADSTLRIRHEVGINTTMLIKQIFNLSNNTFPTLPYDITYNCVRNKSALRFGVGFTFENTTLTRIESSNSPFPTPDDNVPTYDRSFSASLRAGWERRYYFDKRFMAYAGIDIAVGMFDGKSQTVSIFNNLPSSYNFQKSTVTQSSMKLGGGPVAGLRFNISKHLSLLTEMPVYAFYNHSKMTSVDYSRNIDFGGNTTENTNSETEITSGSNISITLPVTIYLVVRF